jgi:hypothetical protein
MHVRVYNAQHMNRDALLIFSSVDDGGLSAVEAYSKSGDCVVWQRPCIIA